MSRGGDLIIGSDGRARCRWGSSPDDYRAYHDHEWGRPVADDARLFEKICLEGFQSGLSWITILRKRDAFRRAFRGFDPARVAAMGPADVEVLMTDRSIVRHRGKIEATLNNGRAALKIIEAHGSLAAYLWQFEPPRRPIPVTLLDLPAKTDASAALARDLKSRGFTFVGPTTAYAFMQAMGLVNDHLRGCAVRDEVTAARDRFTRPGPQ